MKTFNRIFDKPSNEIPLNHTHADDQWHLIEVEGMSNKQNYSRKWKVNKEYDKPTPTTFIVLIESDKR